MIYIEDINNISISDCEFLQIIGYNYQDIKTLSLFSDNIRKHKIHLFGVKIEKIAFGSGYGSIPRYELALNGCKIEGGAISHAIFDDFSTVNSVITNTKFSYISFPNNKEKFNINESIFEKNYYFNVNWGNYFTEKASLKIRYTASYMKDVFRMFKFEYDSIGNKTEGNKFFAKEMEYYRKSLLDNYTWRTFFDLGIGQKRVICWYNQLTNDFGNSWIRPIFWMILLVAIATIYEFLSYNGYLDWNQAILSNILPISEIGKFDNWFSFFYQIAWAALIYQFVVALRRISQR